MKKSLTCFQHKWRNCLSNFEAAHYFLHNKADIYFTCYTVNSAHPGNGSRVCNCVLRSQIPLSETVLFFFFLFILQAIGEGTGEVNGTTSPPPQKKEKSITVLSHVPLSSFLFVVLVVWQILSIKMTNKSIINEWDWCDMSNKLTSCQQLVVLAIEYRFEMDAVFLGC